MHAVARPGRHSGPPADVGRCRSGCVSPRGNLPIRPFSESFHAVFCTEYTGVWRSAVRPQAYRVWSVQSIGFTAVMSCHRRSAPVYSVVIPRASDNPDSATIASRLFALFGICIDYEEKYFCADVIIITPSPFPLDSGKSRRQWLKALLHKMINLIPSLRAPQPCSWGNGSKQPRPKHWTNEVAPFFFSFHSRSFIPFIPFPPHFSLGRTFVARVPAFRTRVMRRRGALVAGLVTRPGWKIWL